jgi:hypothetical protein
MVRIGSVVMNVGDTGRAAEFWRRALGYASSPGNPAFLLPDRSEGPRLHLDEEDRMHLDLWVASAEEQHAEVERLISLGAKRVDWEYRATRTSWSSLTPRATCWSSFSGQRSE